MGRIFAVTSFLFLCDRYPPDIGGVAVSGGRISRAIAQLGYTVDVLVWSRHLPSGSVSAPESITDQLTVWRLGVYRQWDMTLPLTLNLLESWHDRQSYRAVWGHYLFPGGFVAVYFAKLMGIKSTVSVRGNDLDRALFPPGDFARLQWTLANADQITSVSHDLAHKIYILLGTNTEKKVLVINNAVDTDCFSPDHLPMDRSSLGIPDHAIILGFSGELRQKKGQDFLLSAWSHLTQTLPLWLLLIGEPRPDPDSPLLLISEHDRTKLIITGHLKEPLLVARHLLLCDLFLLPSLWEGLPNALLEAMACGLCCLASDAGGIPEVISHGQDGFLLPRSQLSYLGVAIQEFFQLPPEQKSAIGRRARQKILANFSFQTEQQYLSKCLEDLGV